MVFTQFRTQGERLQKDLQRDYPGQVLFFHGGLNQLDRQKTLLAFRLPELRQKKLQGKPLTDVENAVLNEYQDKLDPKVMVLTTKAGNSGLNLQTANHVIHYDRWWNPAVENQATARSDRMGQTKDVHVHYLQTEGTIEEAIQKIIYEKSDTIANVIPAGKNLTSKLSTRTLETLLGL